MESSEYGKGLVICLVKFAEHKERWRSDKRLWREMEAKDPRLFTEANAIEKHFNASSDHLYEIEVPPKWRRKKLGKKVKELQDLGLEMGHSFNSKQWTEDDFTKAYGMCQEIAILIDKEIGLEPDKGSW